MALQQSDTNPYFSYAAASLLLAAGLYLLNLYNYLFFHILIELFSIIIAFTIFVIGWSTKNYSRNNMIIILAAGFLVVGSIDLLHTLSFKGMEVFPQFDANAPTQFWMAARYVQAVTFLLAAHYLGGEKEIRPRAWLYGFMAVGALLIYTVFAGHFPDCFIEGEGLTPFKVAGEYIISGIFVAAGFVFWKKKAQLGEHIVKWLLLACLGNVLAAMSFTLYVDVYGFYNYLGHIFKLAAVIFIYRALVFESLTNPFHLLFRKIAVANEKLTHNEKKFRDLVEQSTDWVWEVDGEGRLSYSNPRAAELTGYALDDILGRTPFDFMSPDGAGKNKNYFAEAAGQRKPFYRFENTILHKNGRPIVFETSGSPIINEQGELMGFRGIARDITERKRVEQELKEARDDAQQASRAKSNFLANMSHEVRTPMHVIMGMTDLLYNSGLNPNQREWAAMVREAATSLLAMINDILDFGRVEAGRLTLEQAVFNLCTEVEQMVSAFAAQARGKGLKLSCFIDGYIPPLLVGDPGRLRQVLLNLVENGLKFTEQGEIVVRLQPAATAADQGQPGRGVFPVLFTISDTGIGIPPDQLNRLFQSFTQVDTSGTRKYEGTGLGLALCRSLVELMGGTIGVKSRQNGGSTFYFTILFKLPPQQEDKDKAFPVDTLREPPVAAASGKDAAPAAERPLASQHKQLEILLVEDKPMNQKLATILLERKGHAITTAQNGREALELFQTRHFDLILMDIHMPEMNGLEATSRIRAAEAERGGHIPIIAMTAYAKQEDQQKCLQAGMDYYVSKPVNAEELYYALERVMGQASGAKPPGDLKGMLQRVDGNGALLEELWLMFWQDYARDMEELQQSLENKDAAAMAAVAHALKGELGNLGMRSAYEVACDLEKLVKENKLQEAASLVELLSLEVKQVAAFFADPHWREQI